MELTAILLFLAVSVTGTLCDGGLGLSYTDRLIDGVVHSQPNPRVAVVKNVLLDHCPLNCPLGLECTREFGSPRCVRVGRVVGIAAGSELQYGDLINRRSNIVHGSSLRGFDRCVPMSRGCEATQFDRFDQCRYTFDEFTGRCIRVYVRNVCARLIGFENNLFTSARQCESACSVGRLGSY